MLFKQRRLALRIESEILSNGVRIKEKDLFNEYETIVPFEHISDQIITSFSISKLYILICVGLFTLFLFNLYDFHFQTEVSERAPATSRDVIFSLFWAVLAVVGTWMRSVRYIGIACIGTNLFFFNDKGKQNPNKYMQNIINARDSYLQQRMSQYVDTEADNYEHTHEIQH